MPRHPIANLTTPRECAAVLKAMGDETRLRILESLLLGEKCVTDLTDILRCSQPHVSHHLRILLRDAGGWRGTDTANRSVIEWTRPSNAR